MFLDRQIEHIIFYIFVLQIESRIASSIGAKFLLYIYIKQIYNNIPTNKHLCFAPITSLCANI